MKFLSKSKIIEAEQFLEGAAALPFQDHGPVVCHDGVQYYVETIHEQQTAIKYGDWIILESKGKPNQAYPCKPDVFEASYSPLNEHEQDASKDVKELAQSLQTDVDYVSQQLYVSVKAHTLTVARDGAQRALDAIDRMRERLLEALKIP